GLKDLLASVRASLNASKENQEVLKVIKETMTSIGQVRERVLNVESYESNLQIPTKDDIEIGRKALDEIQAEIDQILQPRIETLDDMINNLTDGGANFVQQRAGIAEALTNLANIIENKRNHLREAQKLAIFGSKADEVHALISSLEEVLIAA